MHAGKAITEKQRRKKGVGRFIEETKPQASHKPQDWINISTQEANTRYASN